MLRTLARKAPSLALKLPAWSVVKDVAVPLRCNPVALAKRFKTTSREDATSQLLGEKVAVTANLADPDDILGLGVAVWKEETATALKPEIRDMEIASEYEDDIAQNLKSVLADPDFRAASAKTQEEQVVETMLGYTPDWMLTDEDRRRIVDGDDQAAKDRLIWFAPTERNLLEHPTLLLYDPTDTEEETDADAIRATQVVRPNSWVYPLAGEGRLGSMQRQPNTISYKLTFSHFHQQLLIEHVTKVMKRVRREHRKIRCSPDARRLLDEMQFSNPTRLPMRIKKWTVLRSPHVNKRARDQFELRTHRIMIGLVLTPTNANQRNQDFMTKWEDWLKTILTHKVCSVKLTKHEFGTEF